jgi:TolC family type I secretion outer membrane protein
VADYVDVVRDQATLDLNINNEQVLRRQLEAVRDRFQVGEVTRTDVAQAEASYAQAIAGRQLAAGNLQVSRANYQRDIGTAPGSLQPPTLSPALPTTRDEAIGLAGSGNPDVIAAQFNEQAAEDDIRVVRGQLLPQVSLNLGYQRGDSAQLPGERSDEQSATVQLAMPLYEGGAIYSQSREAQQTAALRRNQIDQARLAAIQLATAAWEQLQSDRASIMSFQSQIRADEIALEGVQQEAGVGERTVLDILNQQQALFQSRVNLVDAQHDEVVAKFTLVSAIGALTAKQLALPVQYYDPDVNFEAVRDKWIGFGTGDDSDK